MSSRAPLSCFPRRVAALSARRQRMCMSSSHKGLHWDELDEEASVTGLLAGRKDTSGDFQMRFLTKWAYRISSTLLGWGVGVCHPPVTSSTHGF
ncbi:DUF2442 domain-containing protein [Paraburkholderia diazotrophica]|uniref:DUF2442 domain-containing protein n=1 Tax=Paraburkholderia diazotrophica TaxID=667676 RepID=UPI000B853318